MVRESMESIKQEVIERIQRSFGERATEISIFNWNLSISLS